MLHIYHRRTIYALATLLVVFSLILLITVYNLHQMRTVFNLGLPYAVEDGLVIALCLAGIVRVFVALIRIEHRRDLKPQEP